MDDPLFDPFFDPWGGGAAEAEAPQAPALRRSPDESEAPRAPARWRSRPGPGPRSPATASTPPEASEAGRPPAPPTGPAPPGTPRARLAGTAGLLRSMAVPRLERIAARLELSRHHSTLEDRLDASTPTVRLRAELRRGPWGAEGSGAGGVLELSLPDGEGGAICARAWIDGEDSKPHSTISIPATRLDGSTVERLALGFLEVLLARG